ncbi:MAG: phenylalanine--tRNA ligase subunit beta, partial [Leptospiraceae bacterium]|nr:phenylalanine--tRNA ligase subunit beta [Leptospiraceae bacterium]
MKLSYNWLCEFVDLNDLPPQELARLLTLKSCEVESVTPFMEHLAEIRVAQIETITPHPAADKLKVCSVAIGHETVQIVTGADNAEVGKKYPLALAGVKLPDGRTLGKAKLRGVESAGMLCSGGELGLSALDFAPAKLDGVMPLPDEWQVGQPLSLYLAPPDTILEIDNKSITHRPDLWCHFGFAREIAALLGRPLKHNPEAAQYPTQPLPLPRIVIEDSAAITYCGAELRNFHIGPSPLWVQLRLLAVGQKPINNIVDISNYVLFEMGQPNHAFDREKLGECVRVSYSRTGEKITLLDGSEWILPEKLVLIRDGEKPVALAGVMGGAGTETTAATKRIFLESATFHRSDIRRAVAATGLRTDSSQRFEKAQNPGKARAAIFRFAELLAREQPGVVLSEIAETSTVDYKKPQTIQTNRNFLAQKLGPLRVAQPDFAAILRQLGFTVSEEGDNLSAIVPDWRKWFDVTIAEDLVEEIGRFIGYGEVATEPLLVPCETPRLPNPLRELEHRLRELCALRLELTEIKSYAFHSAQDLAADEFYTRAANAVAIRNSLHADLSFLRISPLPGLLRAVHANYREHRVVRLFEIEKIFLPSSVAHQPCDECLFLAVAAVADEPEKTAVQ